MNISSDLSDSLQKFVDINDQFKIAEKALERNKKIKQPEKIEYLLNYLATELFLDPQHFSSIFNHFSKYISVLLQRVLFSNKKDDKQHSHILKTILLGRILRKRRDLQGFALKYFSQTPSVFETIEIGESSSKKLKMEEVLFKDLQFVESCYHLLKNNPQFYRNKWNWSTFLQKYFEHEDNRVKWISCQIFAILFGMSENQTNKIILNTMTQELHTKFTCIFNLNETLDDETSIPSLNTNPLFSLPSTKTTEDLISFSGISIPVLSTNSNIKTDLVEVPSTISNLGKIALGLTLNKAICLQGPVGSGKTTLVEYFAEKTGRNLGENFIKVQLGDQTDSKMLLGTYRCTDVPGEFVWQPGVLTQAVLEGSWLLLEDIDSASMDIASMLTSLLENNSLTVPGYRDSVPVTPGFQLFVTHRFVSTITGHHKKHSNSMSLLEKHLLQINIDPLTNNELKQIVNEKYPEFHTISDRLVSAFLLFNQDMSDPTKMYIPKSGRQISTRDFFKWCARSIIDFDVKSQASALKVLQDSIDVFCCSFSKQDDALDLARKISTHLGIVNHKAEYFFKDYKPTMQLTPEHLVAGRVVLTRDNNEFMRQVRFSFTRPSSVLLERIMCCVKLNEPVLLVGETGTGKTSCVQYLAHTIGQKLVVINMNQQSDSADLLGGFKPVDLKYIISPIRNEFEQIFCDFFQVEPNKKYLSNLALCFNNQRWSDLVKLMTVSYQAAEKRLMKLLEDFEKLEDVKDEEKVNKYHKGKVDLKRWRTVGEKLNKLEVQLKHTNALAFAFIEGSLVKAVENGHWVLLDEINLANAETLECLSGLLEGSRGSLCLLERGDKTPVKRHPNFTLFACMNPSTDVGKKDLPAGLRNRFTEFFVDELNEKNDLLLLVNNYLEAMSIKQKDLENIVNFYLKVRKETIMSLSDGLGHKPHFSLRSLCRALIIASKNPCGMFKRSLYEAFCLSFLTQLDSNSYQTVERLISSQLIGDAKAVKAILNQRIPIPESNEEYLPFEGYWVKKGQIEPSAPEDYILTASVRRNLKDLVRVVSIGRLPVLLQGDTSVGKTSLITYLAKSSGNKCVRINNHEHTDLQEYIGSYVADLDGKLVFREGLLVEAMRKGHWIILDELNLAPTDVLEALNRVLDDNRELFIPETQETVKADPNFMLFATQNPPGAYGGRKMLSRAFRNRFVELHFNEIPPKELEFILYQRCQMAPSYAKKMINVMTELQMRRRGSAAFAGKQGFITLRDLFRWGERYRLAQNSKKLYDWDQHLADEGYLVLAGKVRRYQEKYEIIDVLQKHLKREVDPENLFTLSDRTSTVTRHILKKIDETKDNRKNIVWTYNMRQLAVLVSKALDFKEPVLLVGETGGGKTTVCKLIAENNGLQLVTVNCHMHTESSDFIGGLRPVRDHSNEDSTKLFEWVDGPLIEAMVQGHVFLADEISLADDSVLERLNSLLEPERSLLLAEKGIDLNNSENSELVLANPKFFFIGTMNPGGDFGKKELSPALRNRFTEIWCEACKNRQDLIDIIERNIKGGISMGNQQDGSSGVGISVMDFLEWFENTEVGKRFTVSVRDILTWVDFLNICSDKMDVSEAYIHGACLTFLDSLGSGITSTESLKSLDVFKNKCLQFLSKQIAHLSVVPTDVVDLKNLQVDTIDNKFGIKPFYVETNPEGVANTNFSFNAPTTVYNTLRLLRGMQLNKAILLEGSPGVGKTSLVTALAKFTGHQLFRINLSDQTDVSDLFGADLPVEGGSGGQFSWRDGPLLQALKNGSWILLDELNLASQSVLEGLNACLDHRGEIFIPELGKTFYVKPGTRFFGCQNPLKQGGSRRGLPQSFLNRFIQVYVNSLTDKDLIYILTSQFPHLATDVLTKMVNFNTKIVEQLENHTFGHKGAPWECNLRDITRWCDVTIYHSNINEDYHPENVVQLIYGDRMRTLTDKERVRDIFEEVFGCEVRGTGPVSYVTEDKVFFGDIFVERNRCEVDTNVLKQEKTSLVLRGQLEVLRSLAYCVSLNWMAILVGTTGAGKSSAVKTLANLAGKTLKTLPVTSAMDTTDILGGFEQTDYSRHLDEVARQTERLSLEVIQEALVDGKIENVLRLMQHWEVYRQISDTTCQSMDQEIKLFLRKVSKLDEILQLVIFKNNLAIVQKLETKLQEIYKSIKKDSSLNAGGKFEWVDSVLIKCLQDGSWLLVDNVNLCSSAVLDRLNALLEPNGVLTISERGVNSDGEMVEIQPHKDFRLFLTMDPKNGEISRAMRNRGIEIYLLNENELQTNNDFDRTSLVSLEGLPSPYAEISIKIHNLISEIIVGEKPNINELIQLATLLAQQCKYQINTSEAFVNTIVEVYYKTRSVNEFTCHDFRGLIHEKITEYLGTVTKQRSDYFNTNLTLKTRNISQNASIEKIKQQSALLFKYFETHLLTVQDVNIEVCYLITNFYSVTSLEDLNLRHIFITEKIKSTPAEILNEKIKNLLIIIINYLYQYVKSTNGGNTELPLDTNWISDHILNDKTSNKVNLGLYFSVHRLLGNIDLHIKSGGNVTLEGGDLQFKPPKGKKITLMEYAILIQQKKVEDRFNNIIVQNYAEIHNKFESYMFEVLSNIKEITDEEMVEILYMVFWRYKLFDCFTFDLKKTAKERELRNVITNLPVHYKWFYKFALRQVSAITKVPLSEDFEDILAVINSKLDKQFSTMHKLGKNYQKCSRRPPPFTTKEQLEIVKGFNDVYKLYDTTLKGNDAINIFNVLNGNKEIRTAFIELKSELDYDFNDISRKFELITKIKECVSKDIGKVLTKFELQLLPILDIFAHFELKNSITTENCTVFVNNILIPTNLSGALVAYHRTKDERLLHEIYNSYYVYLMNSPSVRPSKFLGLEKAVELCEFGPKLTYLLTGLLINSKESENLGKITLGNFRDLSKQHESLNLILWRNLYQLSDEQYSFVSVEKQNFAIIYKRFLTELSNSLKINAISSDFPKEMTEQIIESLKKIQNSPTYVDPNQELPQLIETLFKCAKVYNELIEIDNIDDTIKGISQLYRTVANLKAKFHSKLSIIDPLAKKTIKRRYCYDAQDMFKIMKTCYESLNEVYGYNTKTRHAYCVPIEKMIKKLEEKHRELSKYVAYRPEDILYETVCEVVNHAFSTIMSENFLPGTDTTKIEQQINKVASYENLIHELSQYRSSYPDIIEPLLSSVAEFLYGFKLNLSYFKLVDNRLSDVQYRIMDGLMSFPVLHKTQQSYKDHVGLLSSGDLKKFVNSVLDDVEQPYIKDQENFRMLKTAIQESFNNAVVNSQINDILSTGDFELFITLIDQFVSSYNKQQEQNEKKKEEADSLYKIKTKCDEKPEEEQQIKEDMQKLFPNYHTIDFADFQQTLDTEVPSEQEPDIKYEEVILHKDLKDVVLLHTVLLKNFTKCEWLNPAKNKTISTEFIRPLIEKFETFSKILNKTVDGVTYEIDENAIGGLNVLLAVKKRYGNTDCLVEQISSSGKKTNDFYKDSNVEEVKSCYHILEELKIKINELLDAWPEQPTLKTIIVVIERISNFDITSPISRFLTGFEILLSKCHEWEEVAHSGVSLSQHQQNITDQIIQWRKLELSMWKNLLNRVHYRLNEALPKWWLHLYNIIHQFVYLKQIDEKELIETLQSFITKSNLAEYQGRLDLLHAFHCHATILCRDTDCEAFLSILWNVYIYFQQFVENVNKKVKDLRSPIEKKLKDYVKIVRWKDVNYWAIKETVEKSHKTLHKFMREYQDALEQPVLPCLHNTSSSGGSGDVGIWDKPHKEESETAYYLDESMEDQYYLVDTKFLENTGGDNIPKDKLSRSLNQGLHGIRDIFKDVMASSPYRNKVKELNVFITDVIETSSHLQKLEVDTTLPKEKQKSQAKNILQQKHRALADLFKSLSKTGLSYKTGLVASKTKDPTSDFLLRPIDLVANFNHQNYGFEEKKIKKIWESSEKYYVKSLMRLDVLYTALQNPAKDLGMHNVERCKGFGLHLLTLIRKQKSDLIDASRAYYGLRTYQNHLKLFYNGLEYLPLRTVDKVLDLLTKLSITLAQYKIILNTTPEDEGTLNIETLDIPLLKSNLEKRITHKNDEMWLKATNLLNKISIITGKVTSQLNKSKADVPSLKYSIINERYVPVADLSKLETDLREIKENIGTVKEIFGNIAITKSLAWLEEEIETTSEYLRRNANIRLDQQSSYDWKSDIKKFLRNIMTITKKLKKEHTKIDVEETTEGIIDEHIKKYLIENISNDLNVLDMNSVLEKIENIVGFLLKSSPEEAKERKLLIKEFLPLLEQIALVYRYYVTQLVSGYRATSKMCSILLNIFIELASKGFCIPPEFSDEFDKEGISKPSDGMGLGEGEGERDVSDKIESEDQLDDAQPAGQEKGKDEDKDCKEEEKGIEMSEDFDSKLQDKEKKEDDDSEEESGDSDAEEQMGDTEKGAEQSNKETFGDEKDEQEEEGEEQEGTEDKDEKGDKGEKEGEDQLGAKEGQTSKEEDDEEKGSSKDKEKEKKEINEMEEPEYDDNQIDPHHGNQPELPEPEPMDLPDDMQLDDGDQNDEDNQNQEENPFDIDTMKAENDPEDKEEEGSKNENEDETKDDERDFSSDDEDIEKSNNQEGEDKEEDGGDDKQKDKSQDSTEPEEDADAKSETAEESALDQTKSQQENIEAMEVDEADAADKAQASKSENQQSNQPINELHQEDKPDQEGVGQSQMEESSSGHTAQTSAPQEIKTTKDNTREDQKRKQKPGESDSKRSLGDIDQPVKKKLKTVESKNDERKDDKDENMEENAEMYQHIKDADEVKTQMLDVATKEQAETQKKETLHEDDKNEEPMESSKDLPPDEEREIQETDDTPAVNPEKTGESKDKKSRKDQHHPDGDVLEDIQDIQIEGDVIETQTVSRSAESTHHTQYSTILETTAARLSMEEINNLRLDVEKQLSGWNEPPSTLEADQAWQKISSVTSSLAQDLSEQLRLVLEPTQATRLRGDFRTGRRINMRKVIPYIASQFRKDKIWLRRTKPSKREYQIVLAIDDSSSMADNHSKELAFESVALISKALTLLETGQLSVLSFGEKIEVIHKLTDTFTDKSGIKLLQKFLFDENKTCIAKLVDFATEMFGQSQLQSTALNAKLLVIVSDGRGVFSEGEAFVKQAVRRAKLANIFTVFVIIDNPENKNSVLDIRMPVFKDGKLQEIQTYMDVFPFSFYIILRDINSLPSVLSDALRQWFEIVSNLDK